MNKPVAVQCPKCGQTSLHQVPDKGGGSRDTSCSKCSANFRFDYRDGQVYNIRR